MRLFASTKFGFQSAYGFLFFLIGCGLMGCEKKQLSLDVENSITVVLNESVDSIQGFVWPKSRDSGFEDTASIEHSHRVTVVYPSGNTATLHSNFTVLDQQDGIAQRVLLTPFEHTLEWEFALNNCKAISSELNLADLKPIQARLENLRLHPPDWATSSSVTLAGWPEPKLRVYIEFRPGPERNTWFLSVEIAIADEPIC
jgi:hypothetical protein